MKKLILALLLISSPVYAYNVTGSVGYGLDQVGVQASGDVVIPCPSGQVMVSSGAGVWACGTASGSTTPAGANTQIQFNNSGAFGASDRFTWSGTKATVSGDGTGVLGALYIPKGDVANQYAVYQEHASNPGSVFHTFKGSGGNAIAMGALFSGGSPVGYTFTDPSGIEQVGINSATGNLNVSSDVVVGGSSVCRSNGTNCPSGGSVPTGTGFYHVNAGSQDAAARAVNLASADVTGILPLANGGTARSSISNDAVLVGNNAGTGFDAPALSDCTGSGKAVTYTAATNTFGCNTISGGSTPTGTGFVHINAGSQDAASRAVNLASSDVTGVLDAANIDTDVKKGVFGITIDGNASTILTGVKGYVTIPYSMTITGWDILGDTSGSIVVDVWKDTYANYPPTVADTIAGTEKPTLSSATKNQDTSLSTWTTTVTAGDVIGFNVDSSTTVTRVTLIIYGSKT